MCLQIVTDPRGVQGLIVCSKPTLALLKHYRYCGFIKEIHNRERGPERLTRQGPQEPGLRS